MQVLGRAIRFAYIVVIARMLGPDATGLYIYGVSLYLTFLGLANFGQGPVLAARLGKSRKNIGNLIGLSFFTILINYSNP